MSLHEILVRKAELAWLDSFGPPTRCSGTISNGARCSRATLPGEEYCGTHLVEPTVPPFDPSAIAPPRPRTPIHVEWREEARLERETLIRYCDLCGSKLTRKAKHLCGSCRSEWKQIKLSVMAGMWDDGWTLKEIAEGIGTSRQSVMNMILVARKDDPGSFPHREPSKRPRTRNGVSLPAPSPA